ncbi:hypothetical protein Dimus_033956 [Dionaea muscipula]
MPVGVDLQFHPGSCNPLPPLNWRRDSSLLPYRLRNRRRIYDFLAEKIVGDFSEELTGLASKLEKQLFAVAVSKESYLDERVNSRLRRLIAFNYLHLNSVQQLSVSQRNDFKQGGLVSGIHAPPPVQITSDIYSPGNALPIVHPLGSGHSFPTNASNLYSVPSPGSFHEPLLFADGEPRSSTLVGKSPKVDVHNALPRAVCGTSGTSGQVHMVEFVNSLPWLQFGEHFDTKGDSSARFDSDLSIIQPDAPVTSVIPFSHVSAQHPSKKRTSPYTSEASPIAHKRGKMDTFPSKTIANLCPDEPLNTQQSEELSIDCTKMEIEPTSTCAGNAQSQEHSGTEYSKSLLILSEQQHREDMMALEKSDKTDTIINVEQLADSTASGTEKKEEKQKWLGVSLTEFFTADEVKQHQQSLRPPYDQPAATTYSSESTCQLCYSSNLAYPPLPIYCLSCNMRIKNHATYYSIEDENGAQLCICSKCYSKQPDGNMKILELSIPKSNLEVKKNDMVTEESWVQCGKCEQWQHQVCALFIDKKDVDGLGDYICPKCYLEQLKSGVLVPLPRTTGFGASNLPSTKLSAHIEQWLFSHLKKEREERAKTVGKSPDEVPGAAHLTVRVVSSVDKELRVKQQFSDLFPGKNYPEKFPYRSKVILLFQMIDGVDVCLFAMYVQEFGSQCSPPNKRCINIAYLDSVKYFRPEIKTVKGEALRTYVYHEILNGYLDYSKKRGFAICYIWACPPRKGDDYILYCHPHTQKTPQCGKLTLWYQTMLRKALEKNIAVHVSNLWEPIFWPDAVCKTKVTAARLPYDGDYLCSIIEGQIKNIEEDGDPQKKWDQISKRSLEALGHANPSDHDAKDVLLMDRLKQAVVKTKDRFFVVYLQHVCIACCEVILSGTRWFCNKCKSYQLCERCHQEEDTHTAGDGQTHKLFQEEVVDVPLDTEDNDAILDNCFLEDRETFLSFCQGNYYRFDTLRRAKYSSTIILYHLHNPTRVPIASCCRLCHTSSIQDSEKWMCKLCADQFNVCAACYKKIGSASHIHHLTHHQPPAVDLKEPRM